MSLYEAKANKFINDRELDILKKVLYLLNYAGKAGTERYVQTLIESLNNKKTKAYFAYNVEGLLTERLKALGVETFQIKLRNRFDLIAAWQLSRLCKNLNIDIIHAQFLRENYIAMLSRLFNPGTSVVYTNHFILANNLITVISNRLITPLQAGIIAVCNRGRERMIANGVDGKKIKVLFNAVDPAYWGKSEASTLRSEFGIDDETMILLCASRFAHDKGHRYLLHSIAKLREITDRKFILVLAGDGPLLEEIKELTKELGLEKYILYTGFRSDIKNLFNGSDIYINSSEHEASSFNIIEALATGLPVVATDKGGNNDIINEQNDCGILVQYEDADDTAGAIKRLIEDSVLRDRLSKNALKAVDEKFNLVKMAEKTYNLYEEFTRKYQAKESIK